MLTQLVYASSAARNLCPSDLDEIARERRARHAAAGVTGALVYHGGSVMEVLEGPPESVEAVFERARADPWHSGMMVLYRGSVESPTYHDWTLGVVRPEGVPAAEVRSLDAVTAPGPSRAHRLLHGFRAVVRR